MADPRAAGSGAAEGSGCVYVAMHIMNRNEAAKLIAKLDRERERREAYERRCEAWLGWVERARQADEDDDEFDEDTLLARALAALEDLSDRRLAKVEARHRAESGELRRRLSVVEAAHADERRRRAVEAERLRRRIASLEDIIARQVKDHAIEIASWRGELRLLSDEIAEIRAIDRLRHSREGRAHTAQVELRLARQALDRQAKGLHNGG